MNKKYAEIYLTHFNKILFNYSFVGAIVMTLILFAALFFGLYYIFAFIASALIILFTIGLIFLTDPGIFARLFNAGSGMASLIKFSYKAYPWIFLATIILSITSLVLTCTQKEKSKTRIIISSCVTAFILIIGIIGLVLFVGGGN